MEDESIYNLGNISLWINKTELANLIEVQDLMSKYIKTNKPDKYKNTLWELSIDPYVHEYFIKNHSVKISQKTALYFFDNKIDVSNYSYLPREMVKQLRYTPKKLIKFLDFLKDADLIESELKQAFMDENEEIISVIPNSWLEDYENLNMALVEIVEKKLLFLLDIYPEYKDTMFGYTFEESVHEAFLKNHHEPNEWTLNHFCLEDIEEYPNLFFHCFRHQIDDDLSIYDNFNLLIEDCDENELLFFFANSDFEVSKYLIERGNSLYHTNIHGKSPLDMLSFEMKNRYIDAELLDDEICYVVYVDYNSSRVMNVMQDIRKVCNFVVGWYDERLRNKLFIISKIEDLENYADLEGFKICKLSSIDEANILNDLFSSNNAIDMFFNKDFEISEFLINHGNRPSFEEMSTDSSLLMRYLGIGAIPYTIVASVEYLGDEGPEIEITKIAYGSYEDCEAFIEWFKEKNFKIGESRCLQVVGTPEDLDEIFPDHKWDNFWNEPVDYDFYEKYIDDYTKGKLYKELCSLTNC
jgi:hypothetical protein